MTQDSDRPLAIPELECNIAERFDRAHCLLVGSGTTALYLSFSAMCFQKGAKVLFPDFTCETAVNAAVFAGLTPVFSDIDLYKFNMEPGAVKQACLSKDISAVVPTHIFGHHMSVEEIREIVGPTVEIVEDSAQSYGGLNDGKCTSAAGKASIISFGDGKLLSCLGGGAILSDDHIFISSCREYLGSLSSDTEMHQKERTELMTRLLVARRQDQSGKPFHVLKSELLKQHKYGYLSTINQEQAESIGFEWRYLDDKISRRAIETQRLDHIFSQFKFIQLPEKSGKEALWRYSFLTQEDHRDDIFNCLATAGVPVSKLFEPCHRRHDLDDSQFPNTCAIAKRIINIRYPSTEEGFDVLAESTAIALENWSRNCQ